MSIEASKKALDEIGGTLTVPCWLTRLSVEIGEIGKSQVRDPRAAFHHRGITFSEVPKGELLCKKIPPMKGRS